MEHILDKFVWNAMNTGNKQLTIGTNGVKIFPKTISPFAGMEHTTSESFDRLSSLIDTNQERKFILFTIKKIDIPKNWKVINKLEIDQMVCEKQLGGFDKPTSIVPLTLDNVDEMMILTKLTNPGPFEKETLLFGNYEGIFIDGRLAAMAGQRLHPKPYAEISAVCTHPDFHGRGFATQLIKSQIRRIHSQSEIPFLHVFPENTTAISVYEKLGFRKRQTFLGYILTNQ